MVIIVSEPHSRVGSTGLRFTRKHALPCNVFGLTGLHRVQIQTTHEEIKQGNRFNIYRTRDKDPEDEQPVQRLCPGAILVLLDTSTLRER